jgi:hypothetical protein
VQSHDAARAELDRREQFLRMEFQRLEEVRRQLEDDRAELNAQKQRLQEMAKRVKDDAAQLAAKSQAFKRQQGARCTCRVLSCVWRC